MSLKNYPSQELGMSLIEVLLILRLKRNFLRKFQDIEGEFFKIINFLYYRQLINKSNNEYKEEKESCNYPKSSGKQKIS